jgi:hypothetical protein
MVTPFVKKFHPGDFGGAAHILPSLWPGATTIHDWARLAAAPLVSSSLQDVKPFWPIQSSIVHRTCPFIFFFPSLFLFYLTTHLG